MPKHHESNVQTTDVKIDRRPDPPAAPAAINPAAVARFFRDPSTGVEMVEKPYEGGKNSIIVVADDTDKKRNKESWEKFQKENPRSEQTRQAVPKGSESVPMPGSAQSGRPREVEKDVGQNPSQGQAVRQQAERQAADKQRDAADLQRDAEKQRRSADAERDSARDQPSRQRDIANKQR